MNENDVRQAEYAEEARERWGHTDAWRESVQRTRGYTEDDWARIRAESDEVFGRMAARMAEGTSPTSAVAMDLAEAHRRHIDRWFYACSPDMHRGLASMYTADPRFTAYFEERHAGLAAFVADSVPEKLISDCYNITYTTIDQAIASLHPSSRTGIQSTPSEVLGPRGDGLANSADRRFSGNHEQRCLAPARLVRVIVRRAAVPAATRQRGPSPCRLGGSSRDDRPGRRGRFAPCTGRRERCRAAYRRDRRTPSGCQRCG